MPVGGRSSCRPRAAPLRQSNPTRARRKPVWLSVDVKNTGRGPALKGRTLLRWDGFYKESNSETKPWWDIWSGTPDFAYIAVGQKVTLRFYHLPHGLAPGRGCQQTG
jgi:hypothetical protein